MNTFRIASGRGMRVPEAVRLAWILSFCAALFVGCGKPRSVAPNPVAPAPKPDPHAVKAPGLFEEPETVLRPDGKNLIVTFLNVGQGDCAVVQTPGGKTVLIDAGPAASAPVVREFLKQQKTGKLDFVIAGTLAEDYVGGLPDVLESMPFGPVYAPGDFANDASQQKLLRTIQSHGGQLIAAAAGQKVAIDSTTTLEFLTSARLPDAEGSPPQETPNLVLRVTCGTTKVLFTGGLGEVERDRLSEEGTNLRAMVLAAPRHGAGGILDADLLKRVRPAIVAISCGQPGYPEKATLAALHSAHTTFYRTDLQGSLRTVCDPQGSVSVLPQFNTPDATLNVPGKAAKTGNPAASKHRLPASAHPR